MSESLATFQSRELRYEPVVELEMLYDESDEVDDEGGETADIPEEVEPEAGPAETELEQPDTATEIEVAEEGNEVPEQPDLESNERPANIIDGYELTETADGQLDMVLEFGGIKLSLREIAEHPDTDPETAEQIGPLIEALALGGSFTTRSQIEVDGEITYIETTYYRNPDGTISSEYKEVPGPIAEEITFEESDLGEFETEETDIPEYASEGIAEAAPIDWQESAPTSTTEDSHAELLPAAKPIQRVEDTTDRPIVANESYLPAPNQKEYPAQEPAFETVASNRPIEDSYEETTEPTNGEVIEFFVHSDEAIFFEAPSVLHPASEQPPFKPDSFATPLPAEAMPTNPEIPASAAVEIPALAIASPRKEEFKTLAIASVELPVTKTEVPSADIEKELTSFNLQAVIEETNSKPSIEHSIKAPAVLLSEQPEKAVVMNSKPKKSAPQPTGTHRQPQSSSDRPAMPQKPISPANSPGGHGVSRPMAKPTKTLTAQPKTVQRTTSLIAKTTEQQRQSNEQQNEQRIESTRPVERSNEQPSVETPTNERVAETMVEQPSVAEVANFIESVRGFGGAFEAPLAAAKIEPASMSQNQFETEPAFADTTSWQADQAEAKRRSANRGNRSARRVSAVQQAA